MVFYTLNQVINLIETIALNHAQVNSFGFGDVSDISTVQEDYPLVWLNVQPSTINENTFTLSLSLLTLDIQKADQANERDTLSDTLSIAQDIYSALTNPEYEDYFIIQYSTSLTPVREGLPDLVNGWGAELSLDIAQIRDRCQIPTKGFIGVSPSNTVAPTLTPSGSQVTGTVITLGNGTWTGTSPITFEYRWTRDNVVIVGETANTYTILSGDDGTVIKGQVRATNAAGPAVAYVTTSNQVDAVNAVAPVNTVAPVVSGNNAVGQTLTSTTGTWTGSPTGYTYQWLRGVTPIGTNSNTYVLTNADAANVSNIKCTVTATNGAGSASANSNTIVQILTTRTYNYIAVNSVTAAIRAALNNMDIGLIANSITPYAFYPMKGASATAQKWNFMNTADTDAAFRLTFAGGITHGDRSIQGDGSGYANTHFIPSSHSSLDSLSIFSFSNTDSNANVYDMGAFDSSTTPANCQVIMQTRLADLFFSAVNQDDPAAAPATTDSTGFHAASRVNSTQEIKNIRGTNTTVSRVSKQAPTIKLFLMGINFNNSPFGQSQRNYGCFGIAPGLDGTQLNTLETLIETFEIESAL
jgi:hypothetical protein